MEAPHRLPELPVGAVVAGRYRVERVLSEGGIGRVFLVTHVELDDVQALKVLATDPTGILEDPLARFRREARLSARINSDHVVRVHDFGMLEEHSCAYLAMEYLEGQDMLDWLEQSGGLSVTLAVDATLQACLALASLHTRGIVHRDIKPSNLFLTRQADGAPRIKLLDLGIARVIDAPGDDGVTTTVGTILGTPPYLAPEQILRPSTADARADVWGLGTTLHALLAGDAPFEGTTARDACMRILRDPPKRLDEVRSDVPRELAGVVLRCLQKRASERYQDVSELAAALAPFGDVNAAATAHRVSAVFEEAGAIPSVPSAPPAASGPSTAPDVAVEEPPPSAPAANAHRQDVRSPRGAPTPPVIPMDRPRPWAALVALLVVLGLAYVTFGLRGSIPSHSAAPADPPRPSEAPSPEVTRPPLAGTAGRVEGDATGEPEPPAEPRHPRAPTVLAIPPPPADASSVEQEVARPATASPEAPPVAEDLFEDRK